MGNPGLQKNTLDSYLILNAERNAYDFLIFSLVSLAQIDIHIRHLKWFIIAFHGAIYSYMLLALEKQNPSLIYSDIETKYLISFGRAYDLLKNKKLMNSDSFKNRKIHDVTMNKLNDDLRNQMIHFAPPLTWASEAFYPARVAYPILKILRYSINHSTLTYKNKAEVLEIVDSIDVLLKRHKK